MPEAKLSVHPPSLVTRDTGEWDPTATKRVAEALEANGFHHVVAEQALPGVPFEAPGHNQLRYTWARAHA